MRLVWSSWPILELTQASSGRYPATSHSQVSEACLSGIAVARAGVEDAARLAPLFDAYRSFYGCPPDLDGACDFLSRRLAKRESLMLYAAEDGVMLGLEQLYPSFSSVRMQSVLILNDLYVIPAARRRGVARMLLKAARDLACDAGVATLQLETGRSNQAARGLYLSEGYLLDQEFEHYTLRV